MIRSENPTKAYNLSLIAGVLILTNSALVAVAATWFPTLIPTLPGSTGNDTILLYYLSAIGSISGAIVLLGALMLRLKPASKKAWGILIAVLSVPSVVSGGGFIIGFILGIWGGVSAFSWKPKTQEKS
jgi:hypothetical protein